MNFGCGRFKCTALLFLATLLFCGCGSGRRELKDIYDTNIKKAHLCYTIFMEQHSYRGPKNKAELIQYISEDQTGRFFAERAGIAVDDLDSVFISSRDGEPFVFRFGLRGIANHAVVFEKTGVEGMRYVALGRPIEVDEETYNGYLEGDIKPERGNQAAMFEGEDAPE